MNIIFRNNTIRLWQPQLFVILDQQKDDLNSSFPIVHTFCDVINNFTFSKDNNSNITNAITSETCVEVKILIIVFYKHRFILTYVFTENVYKNQQLFKICLHEHSYKLF